MFGAIIGDTVGSIYEGQQARIKTKDFPFFGLACRYTDDSVCTAAVADILLHNLPPAATMQKWCRTHPRRGYSRIFTQWVYLDEPEPYNLFYNGAAMRVSPAAFLNREELNTALAASDKVTEITHNHPEGMKGARATTHAIWLAFHGESPDSIRKVITAEYGYELSQTVDEIRRHYAFDMTCQGTVPPAIACALEATSFEDAVRNAVSLGGDSDTLAAIAGPIAEALHGIPDEIREQAESRYLTDALSAPQDVLSITREMYQAAAERK